MNGEVVLTVPEVAEALRVSEMSIYRAVQNGQLPGLRIGRKLRISKAVFDRMLDPQVEVEAEVGNRG